MAFLYKVLETCAFSLRQLYTSDSARCAFVYRRKEEIEHEGLVSSTQDNALRHKSSGLFSKWPARVFPLGELLKLFTQTIEIEPATLGS